MRNRTPKRLIVKVQIPITTNDPHPKSYVYDRHREIEEFFPITPDLLERMNNRLKVYFYATLEDGDLNLQEEAPEQEW
jgi:hypothetical protein